MNAVAELAFTDDELRALFRLDSAYATTHARCGPKSGCRVRAIADVDNLLDQWLTTHPIPTEAGRAPAM